MQSRAAYTDPNITVAIGDPIPTATEFTESIPLISTQQLTPIYNPVNLDRSAAVETPDIAHKSTHWPLGRNLYAIDGEVK